MTVYYVNAKGVYLGSFANSDPAPQNSTKVPLAPPRPSWIWDASLDDWREPKTFYYRDAAGNFLGGFCENNDPPIGGVLCDTLPDHGTHIWDDTAKAWKAAPSFYQIQRLNEYQNILLGDQLDAVYKFAINLPAYIAAGKITPDATKTPDTPEGWLARISAIKSQFPKPQ